MDSSEPPKRFSLTIALQILHFLTALFQWWFLVLAHLTAPSCFEGSFRAQLAWEKKLAPAMQEGGDLDSQFQRRLWDLGAQILLKVSTCFSQLFVKSPLEQSHPSWKLNVLSAPELQVHIPQGHHS